MLNIKGITAKRFSLFAVFLLLVIGAGSAILSKDSVTKTAQASPGHEMVVSEASTDNNANNNTSSFLSVRGLGDPNAPVTITEHSSLTCGHCGNFHKTTFKEIKEKLIDTGKVYLIFQDFPLEKTALSASMLARCLPEERYFPFIQLLFETQEKWAYTDDPIKHLRQNAQLAGLSSDKADACLANEDLRDGILHNMQQEQTSGIKISSTPTFIVVNEKSVIKGVTDITPFEEAVARITKK